MKKYKQKHEKNNDNNCNENENNTDLVVLIKAVKSMGITLNIYSRRASPLVNLYCYTLKEIQLSIILKPLNSLQNSGAKYVSNIMLRRIYNFSLCLGNNSAKKTAEN